jgi:hypothetical protein
MAACLGADPAPQDLGRTRAHGAERGAHPRRATTAPSCLLRQARHRKPISAIDILPPRY